MPCLCFVFCGNLFYELVLPCFMVSVLRVLGAQWPKSRDATAMRDAIRIAHPQIASDAKPKTFSLVMRNPISLI